jgi:hypothetical protein
LILKAFSGHFASEALAPAQQYTRSPCGITEIGRLKPSTRLTSKKSCLLFDARVNSTNVTSAISPAPLHGI